MTNNDLTRRSEIIRNYKDSDVAIKAIDNNDVSLEEFIKYGSNLVFGQKFMDMYNDKLEREYAIDMLMYKFDILSEYELVVKYISQLY